MGCLPSFEKGKFKMVNKKEKYILSILKKYDFNKLNAKNAELFEIVNKYELYRKTPSKWYLKPVYDVVYFLAKYLAEKESAHALIFKE